MNNISIVGACCVINLDIEYFLYLPHTSSVHLPLLLLRFFTIPDIHERWHAYTKLVSHVCRALINWRQVPNPEYVYLQSIGALHRRVWPCEANN